MFLEGQKHDKTQLSITDKSTPWCRIISMTGGVLETFQLLVSHKNDLNKH